MNGTAAFNQAGDGRKDSHAKKLERQNAQLKAKLAGKDEVIAEIMASHVQPQSNGKLERYHKTIKGTCIRVRTPLSLGDARDIVADRDAKLAAVREARKAQRKAS